MKLKTQVPIHQLQPPRVKPQRNSKKERPQLLGVFNNTIHLNSYPAKMYKRKASNATRGNFVEWMAIRKQKEIR
jgi:hypothetical protein